jgi:hypothetical protein
VFATALMYASWYLGNLTTNWFLFVMPDTPEDPFYEVRVYWFILALINIALLIVVAVFF